MCMDVVLYKTYYNDIKLLHSVAVRVSLHETVSAACPVQLDQDQRSWSVVYTSTLLLILSGSTVVLSMGGLQVLAIIQWRSSARVL